MKKSYLLAVLSLIFAFAMFSSVLAKDGLSDDSEDGVRMETRTRTEMGTTTMNRQDDDDQDDDEDDGDDVGLESHREELKNRAEVRKAEAEAKGDEMKAKREQMKLDLEAKWAEMDAKREAKRVEIEERRASSTERRIEFQQEIAKRKVEHVTKVMLATIERLEKIIARIESRIEKIKARGGDTTEGEKFVADAKTNLLDARTKVSTFADIDLSSDKAAENFERIRAAAAEAREIIRKAHENLMMAVRSLRAVEIDTEDSNGSGSEE